MRCFLAIELDEHVRRHLDRVQARLVAREPAVSWVRRENWHVTLKFLGELDDATVVKICESLHGVAVDPMTLFAERMVYFPRRGPVRVIAAELGGDTSRLGELYHRVKNISESIGLPREMRAFSAHITLGRSRRGLNTGTDRSSLEECFPGPPFVACAFALFQSELLPRGPRYTRLAMFGDGS
jgi:RNA 2',3'-cyclic 3'-phosphodiesterase